MIRNAINYLFGCRRCKARERVLVRAAGNRQEISPELWGLLHGHTEKAVDTD